MKPTVFFAIPCGEFYRPRTESIKRVSKELEIIPVIEETFSETDKLWRGITKKIDESDFFVADVADERQNVALELGYVLARKPLKRIGIFTSSVMPIPSDAEVFKYQLYSSLSDFRSKLKSWLESALELKVSPPEESTRQPSEVFREGFMNQDWFLRRWFTPAGSSWYLSSEGLRLTQAHFPIQTTTLGLLKNYEFEFKARIDKGSIGWAVQTTMRPRSLLPSFCVMFQLGKDNILTPLIWNERHRTETSSYKRFDDAQVRTPISKKEDWFTLITRVRGDVIEIEHDGKIIFNWDFAQAPFKEWNELRDEKGNPLEKDGNVGFRCYLAPNGGIVEEATVNYAIVRELAT